jgi:hypothetical protein
MGNTAVYAAKAFSFDGGTYDFSFDWMAMAKPIMTMRVQFWCLPMWF